MHLLCKVHCRVHCNLLCKTATFAMQRERKKERFFRAQARGEVHRRLALSPPSSERVRCRWSGTCAHLLQMQHLTPSRDRRRDSTGSLFSDAASNAWSNAETETETYIRASQASARESSRAIAPVVGANHNTVARDLWSVSNDTDAPRTVKSLDGVDRTFKPRKPEPPRPVPPPLNSTVPVQDGCGRSLRPAFAWSPAPTPRLPTPRSPLRWHAD